MAHPGGRPTKYKKEYCELIPDLMAEGMSKVEVCAELGICYQTFLNWQAKHPKFLESIKKGEDLSRAWWMTQGRINLENRNFNAVLWFMNMRNRHEWSNKQKVEITGLNDLGNRLAGALERRKEYEG
jgi:transposase